MTVPTPCRAACLALLLAALPAGAAWDVGGSGQTGQTTVYLRTAGGAGLGLPLAAGDLDGDGRDDLILTPMNADSGPTRDRFSAGEVAIVFSGATSTAVRDLAALDAAALPEDVLLIYGAGLFDNLGTEVATADLDGDGFDDAILGAQYGDGADNQRLDAGEVWIVWGGAQRGGRVLDLEAPPAGAVTQVVGADAGDRLGVWVSAADVDGDGVADALLGADQADGPAEARRHAGATYVLYGGIGVRAGAVIDLRLPLVPVTEIHGIDAEDHSGATVRGADVDGDGVGDVLIGAGLNRLSAQSDASGGFSGHGLAGGDGPDNRCDPIGLNCEIGEAYIVFGTRGTRPATVDLAAPPPSTAIIYGVDRFDAWGEELFAGDFDGDGRGDVAIGALTADGPDNTRPTAGELALVRGDANGLRGARIDLAQPPANVTLFYGARSSAIAGDTALLLDVDGDGRDELVIASPQDAPVDVLPLRSVAGTVLVLFGTAAPLPATIDLAAVPSELAHLVVNGAGAGDLLAYSMSVGDLNGDGLRDLVLNAMGGDGFEDRLAQAGDAYVLDAVALSRAAGREAATPGPTVPATPVPTVPATPMPTPTQPPTCAGDCDGDAAVDIGELVIGVNIALGAAPATSCAAADANGDGTVAVNELVASVSRALDGCAGR